VLDRRLDLAVTSVMPTSCQRRVANLVMMKGYRRERESRGCASRNLLCDL
jgi:hypothetical protein